MNRSKNYLWLDQNINNKENKTLLEALHIIDVQIMPFHEFESMIAYLQKLTQVAPLN